MSGQIKLYDTTLRDGAQAQGVSFSLNSKLKITEMLDEVGMDFIEGGWPGANPKDTEYFKIMKKRKLQNATLVAFGSTRKAGNKVENDPSIQALIEAETERIAIFCKGWDFHVREALKISLEENLELIYDSVTYLKKYIPVVGFGIEHFYDGFKNNPDYLLKIVETAIKAGASHIGTADTNGGCLPDEIAHILTAVKKRFDVPYSIHAHNDCGLAIANTIKAIECGATFVHGTINGIGERCGMPDHCVLIPIIKNKMGIDCVSDEQLKLLRKLSIAVAEMGNIPLSKYTPFVGDNAFFHKAGVHLNAMLKNPYTYHHIDPTLVGNQYTSSLSELSGKANVHFLAQKIGIELEKTNPGVVDLINYIKERENLGIQYENAEASCYVLMMKFLKNYTCPVKVKKFVFEMEQKLKESTSGPEKLSGEARAIVSLEYNNELIESSFVHEKGPLSAIKNAIYDGLKKFLYFTDDLRVTDITIKVIDYTEDGFIKQLRLNMEITDRINGEKFYTVGAAADIYQAFIEALLDGVSYYILTHEEVLDRN